MRYLIVVVLVASCASVTAADNQIAAACYLAGEQAWNAGRIDDAIAAWTKALELKPSSTATKDRLIDALRKKVEQLEAQLANKSVGGSGPREIVIKSAAVPVVTGERILDASFTADAIREIMTGKYTEAQKEQYWARLAGWKVRWSGKVNNVKPIASGQYTIDLTCGQTRVVAVASLSETAASNLSIGTMVTVFGSIDKWKNPDICLTGCRVL